MDALALGDLRRGKGMQSEARSRWRLGPPCFILPLTTTKAASCWGFHDSRNRASAARSSGARLPALLYLLPFSPGESTCSQLRSGEAQHGPDSKQVAHLQRGPLPSPASPCPGISKAELFSTLSADSLLASAPTANLLQARGSLTGAPGFFPTQPQCPSNASGWPFRMHCGGQTTTGQ